MEPFSVEDKEITFDDWLPGLERAALWNGWTNAELLLQSAGHLRGRALQEWNLLQPQKKEEYKHMWDMSILAYQQFPVLNSSIYRLPTGSFPDIM